MTGASGLTVRQRLRSWLPVLALVLGWLGDRWYNGDGRYLLNEPLEEVILRVFSGFPSLQVAMVRAVDTFVDGVVVTWILSLFVGSLGVPLAVLVRMVARARARAGHRDFLQRARAWMDARPRLATALLSLPALVTQGLFARVTLGEHWRSGWAVLATTLVVGLAQWRLTRGGWRALVAPLTVTEGGDARIDPDEIRFRAVAVTRETKAAVASLAALSVGVVAWVSIQSVIALFTDRTVFAVVGAYVAIAASSAWLFQQASRIAVGRDGVYVGGSSRRRFFAYRALDEARERGSDLELVRRRKVVLRLQLHGEDAARRGAVVERIREGIAHAEQVEREGAANFVAAVPTDAVTRSAVGGASYRMRWVSPEALWSLVEGAGVDAAARTAAARALVASGGDPARIRVAAALCAEPAVRDTLEDVAESEDVREARGSTAGRSNARAT